MPDDYSEIINNLPGNGWVKAMGLVVTRATFDEVACEWQVGEQHMQGDGIVHGRLRGVARPLTRGRTSQAWLGEIRDQAGKLVAHGTVRLLCIPGSQPLADDRS